LIETIKNYAYDGGILLGLLIALLAFLGVAWHSLTVYADVQNQRKTWKDLGAVVGIGALLVVIIIWFLTKASDSCEVGMNDAIERLRRRHLGLSAGAPQS
jgi:integrating conjugative element membrane protein (TIGR03745 family)